MLPTLVDIYMLFDLTFLVKFNMSGCKVYNMNTKYQTIVLLSLLNVSSHINYHICQYHVNCHFVSCIGRCGYTATCQEPGMQYH